MQRVLRAAQSIREEVRRIQIRVAKILEHRAVKLVGAAFGDDTHLRAVPASELGRGDAGLNREFLYRVNAALSLRLHGVPTVGGVLSFDPHSLCVRRCPVDSDVDVRRISSAGKQLHNGVGIAYSRAARGSAD